MTPPANHWRDRRVLVTGCTGLLGSWLTERLVASDADVVGLVRDTVPRSRLQRDGVLDRITVVHGGIDDYLLLERTMAEYEVQTIFHLAAQTIVGVANSSPLSTFDANIKGTWNILEAARRSRTTENVIVASSDKAYGTHEVLPYDEDARLQGRHPYDVSKSCADLISASYRSSFDLPVCVTRLGNLFGGGDLNFNRLVPGTIRSAIRGEAPVIRSDGTFTRDYIYVEDAAEAYMVLAEAMSATPSVVGEAFNFSYEHPRSALEVVQDILAAMGSAELHPVILGHAPNEIPHQYLSAQKARTMLDWKPAIDFGLGLERTIAWYEDLFGGTA